MNAAQLRITLDWLGLTLEDAAEILGVTGRQVRRWIAGTSRVPAVVGDEIRQIEEATAQVVADVVEELRTADQPVIVAYRSAEQMWTDRPELSPYPPGWWRMVAARALDEADGDPTVIYQDVIRATWAGVLTDPETEEERDVRITSPAIDVTGVDDVDEVAQRAIWLVTPPSLLNTDKTDFSEAANPSGGLFVERVTDRADATAGQLLKRKKWKADNQIGLEWLTSKPRNGTGSSEATP